LRDRKCKIHPASVQDYWSHNKQLLTTTIRYQTLGPHWSATMLAIIEFALIPIPVVFYRYGHKIREKSALIRQMREDKERLEGRKKRAVERLRVEKGVSGAEEKKEIEV
jgi:hypothetical protein